METPSLARPPGKKANGGLIGEAVQTAVAEHGARVRPLGSGISERPAPPDSATYRSLPTKSSALTPRPSLVAATRETGGAPEVVVRAPATFMMLPVLRKPTYRSPPGLSAAATGRAPAPPPSTVALMETFIVR